MPLALEGGLVSITVPWLATKHCVRICPGMSLADNSVFLAVSTLLYIFDISMARGANGEDVTPRIEYDGFIWCVQRLCII